MEIDKVKTAQEAKAPVEQVAKKQQEYHLIGKQRKVRGHILFEFNKQTKEIKQAAVTRKALWGYNGTAKFETRVDIHQDCFYVQALNAKNAVKKLIQIGLIRDENYKIVKK